MTVFSERQGLELLLVLFPDIVSICSDKDGDSDTKLLINSGSVSCDQFVSFCERRPSPLKKIHTNKILTVLVVFKFLGIHWYDYLSNY